MSIVYADFFASARFTKILLIERAKQIILSDLNGI